MSGYEEMKPAISHHNVMDINNVYNDHIVQAVHPHQSTTPPSWYDYSSFNSILVNNTLSTLPQQLSEPVHHHHHHQVHHESQEHQQPQSIHPQSSLSELHVVPPLTDNDQSSSKPNPSRPAKQRVSQGEKTYFCQDCNAPFSNSSNLKSHLRIHKGEKPYVCDLCSASFVQSSNLKAHKRVHTGERPYVCSECNQSFSRSSHLTGHKRTHTGERPYICGICNEGFVTSTHLRNHMRKHTGEKPFICKKCGNSFAQNAALLIHLRIHSGERPFKCSECTAAFRSKGDLRSHSRLHTHHTPFPCTRCPKTFKTAQYLRKHLKKCGAPPSGKKRGRPRIANVVVLPAMDDLTETDSEVGKCNGRRRIRNKSVKNKKVTKSVNTVENEGLNNNNNINNDTIPILPTNDGIPENNPNNAVLQTIMPEECLESGRSFSEVVPSMSLPQNNRSLQITSVEHIDHMPMTPFNHVIQYSI